MDLTKLTGQDVADIFCIATGEEHSPIVEMRIEDIYHKTQKVSGKTVVALINSPFSNTYEYVMTINEFQGVSITSLYPKYVAMHIGGQFEIVDLIRKKCC